MLENKVSRLLALDELRQLVGTRTHTDFGLHSQFRPLSNNTHSPLGSSTSPKHTQEFSKKVSSKLAKDVMHLPVITINDDAAIPEVMQLLLDPNIPRLPIVGAGKLEGIIARHDFLKPAAAGCSQVRIYEH